MTEHRHFHCAMCHADCVTEEPLATAFAASERALGMSLEGEHLVSLCDTCNDVALAWWNGLPEAERERLRGEHGT